MSNQQSTARGAGQQGGAASFRNSSPVKLSRKNTVVIPEDAADAQFARKEEEDMERDRDALRQAVFQEASDEALEIPVGYLKVAVKIIRWDESIDDFYEGHTKEVSTWFRSYRIHGSMLTLVFRSSDCNEYLRRSLAMNAPCTASTIVNAHSLTLIRQ
jgi:hypothetical protein